MKIYRYYYEAIPDYFEKAGFLIRIDEILSLIIYPKLEDELLKLVAIFEDELDAPDSEIYKRNPTAVSYFTQKGNRKFHKAINDIKTYLFENYHQEMICITKEISKDDERILYIDNYQLVLKE